MVLFCLTVCTLCSVFTNKACVFLEQSTSESSLRIYIYRVAQKKSKPPPIFQKIVLKIANEIRFLRKVKV